LSQAPQAADAGSVHKGIDPSAELVIGRGDSAVAEALDEAVQDPREVAAAVVAVDMDGASGATAILPAALEASELAAAIAQESIAIAQAAAAQQQAGQDVLESAVEISRKRSSAEALPEDEAGAGGGQAVHGAAAEPKRRRRFLKGMEVVWKFFGVDPAA
jgi:hypothetical protein